MRVTTLLATLLAGSAAIAASPSPRGLGPNLNAGNHYGAPTPPWGPGAHPGWYFGKHPEAHPGLTCLSGLICGILKLLPLGLQCPKTPPGTTPSTPSDGYTQTFSNLSGATQAGDYMTFGLVDTVADCKAMCNTVPGCGFVNTYHDVNGKNGSPLLTCSLFRNCHTAADATNTGGQTQPNGSVNHIANSDGWCKA
ncbi:hypothetical protein P691DRAFT_761546 [Macrolepiota fuliginosa MF-IS2]|uniref:Apple domain-containing protein n=1 Tax=Macrolepiota fuliginosa MF-IS2 TaxID=1400762 RepID=A0A9P5X803_9AGAR|nr:hypothetical protein P691DRAFT_761546 [Macrolepiota fuliginosa MF-IS2]